MRSTQNLKKKSTYVWFMSFGQSVECRNWCWMSNICYCYLVNCSQVLHLGAHSKDYKGELTQFVVICTTFRSAFHVGWKNQDKHSTQNSSFDALSKWHADIKIWRYWVKSNFKCVFFQLVCASQNVQTLILKTISRQNWTEIKLMVGLAVIEASETGNSF